jgi:ComF family protein
MARTSDQEPQEAAVEAAVPAEHAGHCADDAVSAGPAADLERAGPEGEPIPGPAVEGDAQAESDAGTEQVAEPGMAYGFAAEPEDRQISRAGKAPAAAGWRRILRRGAMAAMAAFIPPLCLHCEGRRFADLPLCLGCLRKLAPVRGRCCTRCGGEDCSDSHIDWPYPFRAIHPLFRVTPPLSTLVHGFKYRHQRRNIAFLCAYLRYRPDLREAVRRADVLVPVPLHPVRRRERGYNQAEAIATGLGEACGRPVLAGALRRIRMTGTQTRLSREERSRNLGGAFACAEPGAIEGRRIVLVDDVFTTGATVAGCAEVLLRSGCASVSVFALGKVEKAEAADDFAAEMEAVASYLA